MNMNGQHNEMEVIDWQVNREIDHMTSGAASHHRCRQPDELAMDHEEGGEGLVAARDALREEIFSGTCDFTLGAGLHPREIRSRIESVMRRFDVQSFLKMRGALVWWDEKVLMGKIDGYAQKLETPRFGMLFSLSKKIREERDQAFVHQSFRGLCGFWTMDGYEWRKAVCAHLVMVKALRPELIGGMSLEDIAVICGDKGKATVSARAKRLFNKRLESMGMHGTFVHYQKSPEAVESYRAAQMGNSNRKRKEA